MSKNSVEICRGCLRPVRGRHFSVWSACPSAGAPFAQLLKRLAGVPVLRGDKMPQLLCSRCALALTEAFAFLRQCRNSYRRLRRKIAPPDPEQEEETSPSRSGETPRKYRLSSPTDPQFLDNASDSDGNPVQDNEPLLSKSKAEDSKTYTSFLEEDPPSERKNGKNTPERKLSCLNCNHIAKSTKQLKTHYKLFHADSEGCIKFDCNVCSKSFKRKCDLIVHLRIHSGEKPFACNYCPMRFTQSGTLIDHKRNHTGEMPFVCKVCVKPFASRSSLSRHRFVHTKERPYVCKICDKSFSHSSTLKHHQSVHSEERPHTCKICNKSTKSKYALRQHMLTHSEKIYVCHRCAKKFTLKANLDSHIKKMHSEVSGRCPVCRKNTSNLSEHMLMHSNELTYGCGLCGKMFRQKNGLSFHMNLHNNAEKYKCEADGCGKGFPKQTMLDFHTLKVHSDRTPHVCQYCSRGFLRMSDLTRHLKSFHRDAKNATFLPHEMNVVIPLKSENLVN